MKKQIALILLTSMSMPTASVLAMDKKPNADLLAKKTDNKYEPEKNLKNGNLPNSHNIGGYRVAITISVLVLAAGLCFVPYMKDY